LNAAALFFYLAPPGGSRQELSEQMVQLRHQIAAARGQTTRMRTTAAKVETGSGQASDFEAKYFLAKRLAYVEVVGEIQRLAKERVMQAPLWELGFLNAVGPRVDESGLGLIALHPYSAPYEEVRLKK